LLFIDSAALALIDSIALLLISGVTFLLTLWLTEALAGVGLASHQVTILGRRGKGMGHTQSRGDKEKGDEKGHLSYK